MRIIIAYCTCALIWGTTWYAIRVSIGDSGYPVFASAAIRFTLAALLLAPIWLFRVAKPWPQFRAEWLWLVVSGMLCATGYALVYAGEQHVSGGLAAVLFGTEPIAVALLATWTRTESVSRNEILGSFIALSGIILIFIDRLDVSTEKAVGITLITIAVFLSGTYTLLIKRHAGNVHPLASTSVFLSVTAVCLWVTVFVIGWQPLPWPPPVKPTIAVAYLGIFGSVIAFVTYFYLIQRVSLMTTVSMVFVLPIIALIVDAIWEEQAEFTARTYVGIAITMSGVLAAVVMRRKESPKKTAAKPPAGPSLEQHVSP